MDRGLQDRQSDGLQLWLSGPFTEIVLLGNVAYRTGEPIEYDPETMKVTNVAKANELLTKTYRKGWGRKSW